MTVEVKQVLVRCPICKKEAKIDIPVFLMNESQDGVLKVQIPQGACCDEHSFMVYIDKKFTVRGYQNADIEFRLGSSSRSAEPPTGEKEEKSGLKNFTMNDIIETLGVDIAAVVIRTVLINRPILFLDTFDLYNRVDKTIAYLREIESDEILITVRKVKREELRDKKIRKLNALIAVPLYKAIMRSPFPGDMKTRFEINLLRETLKIPDRGGQIIYLRRELIKISKIIEELAKVLKSSDKIYEEDLPDIINDKFNYRLELKYVDIIKDVIKYKYNSKLSSKIISKSLDKIRSDLW
ncbi:MAG: hypothetical protein ACTSVI_10865 [Promethearchaeota archaeon]